MRGGFFEKVTLESLKNVIRVMLESNMLQFDTDKEGKPVKDAQNGPMWWKVDKGGEIYDLALK